MCKFDHRIVKVCQAMIMQTFVYIAATWTHLTLPRIKVNCFQYQKLSVDLYFGISFINI